METSEELGADGIVVSSRGLSGWQRVMLGSVSTYLVHHARRAVVVVGIQSSGARGKGKSWMERMGWDRMGWN